MVADDWLTVMMYICIMSCVNWSISLCVVRTSMSQARISSSSYRFHCMPSHLIASSPVRCRVVRPPGNLDRGQSFIMWLVLCFAAPQLQGGSGVLHRLARFGAHCPWPVLKWFKFAHSCRGKLKPGGRAVGSRPRIGWSHLYPAIHQELTTLPEEHPTILDAVSFATVTLYTYQWILLLSGC